jgi:hypothetical protein
VAPKATGSRISSSLKMILQAGMEFRWTGPAPSFTQWNTVAKSRGSAHRSGFDPAPVAPPRRPVAVDTEGLVELTAPLLVGGQGKRHGYASGFLQAHLQGNWEIIRHAQVSDPALGFLSLLEKTRS